MPTDPVVPTARTDRPETALALAGGGLRAAFAAGAVHALGDLGLARFDVARAVSASVPTLAYFAAGQMAEIRRIWSRHLATRHLVRYGSLLRELGCRPATAQPLIDTEYLVNEILRRHEPLDVERLRLSPTRCRFVAAQLVDREPGLARTVFHQTTRRPFAALRACMALPGVTRAPISIGEHRYVDGGLLEPLPFTRRGIGRGRRTLVVLNDPLLPGAGRGDWFLRLRCREFFRRYPVVEAAFGQLRSVRRACASALRLAALRGEALVIAPARPTPARLVTRSRRRIRKTFDLGYEAVRRSRREIDEFLFRPTHLPPGTV